MARKYKAIVILPPQMDEDAARDVIGKVQSEVTRLEGEVASVTMQGKRELARAFANPKVNSGFFVELVLNIEPNAIDPLRARLRLNEQIIRTMIIRMDEKKGAADKPTPADNEPVGVAAESVEGV